jgi:hypothetical protein
METGVRALRVGESWQMPNWRESGTRRSERSRQIGFAGTR